MTLRFDDRGLIPCIVQDQASREVLMLGWMNHQALEQTLSTGLVTFFSRSRQQLWTKGETSGNLLHVDSVRLDCDGDALLVLPVRMAPPATPVRPPVFIASCHE